MTTNLEHYLFTFPHYREPLELLLNILGFQAALAQKIETGRQELTRTQAMARWEAQQPLFSGETGFSVDPAVFQEALAGLRPLLSTAEATRTALDRLLANKLMSQAILEDILLAFRTGDEARLQHLAHSLAIDPEALAFVLQTALTPFVENAAQPYRKWIELARWRDGYCPICGGEPVMARLTGEAGRRILTCSLCRTEWAFERLRCPFCEDEAESPTLNYFTVDNDEAHRVDCCDQCHCYLKTVDERAVNYTINLFAENIITAHLDTIANEQGYR
jgi:formate dehydrogenase accessory protein FdhE